jgi:Na+/H+ antiporter NhaD/arsenite permease-like protein
VTFLVCERLAIPAAPLLLAEALASNIGGAATLIGDPPNIIIARQADLSYLAPGPPGPLVVLLMLLFVGSSCWLFCAALTYRLDHAREVSSWMSGRG